MTDEERKLALYCLKASSDYHSEVCEDCIKYHNCDHTIQDDVTETIIQLLEQEPIIDKIRAEIKALEYLSIEDGSDGYDNYIEQYKVLKIIDKYKEESEE